MNQWDTLSEYFNTHKSEAEIDSGAADNILIAWPSILRGIQTVQPKGSGLKALDYGCGGGSFTAELRKQGYVVVGSDSSPKMIEIAKRNLGENIPFYVCDDVQVRELREAPFELITGIMVFQFTEDIVACFSNLDAVLTSGGVLAFAVHNPDYVRKNYGEGNLFRKFETPEQPTRGYWCFKEVCIPIYIRVAEEYDWFLAPLGFVRVYADKPPFTSEFLQKHPVEHDATESEYLVLVYRKK